MYVKWPNSSSVFASTTEEKEQLLAVFDDTSFATFRLRSSNPQPLVRAKGSTQVPVVSFACFIMI
jgi:hypothetical protein